MELDNDIFKIITAAQESGNTVQSTYALVNTLMGDKDYTGAEQAGQLGMMVHIAYNGLNRTTGDYFKAVFELHLA